MTDSLWIHAQCMYKLRQKGTHRCEALEIEIQLQNFCSLRMSLEMWFKDIAQNTWKTSNNKIDFQNDKTNKQAKRAKCFHRKKKKWQKTKMLNARASFYCCTRNTLCISITIVSTEQVNSPSGSDNVRTHWMASYWNPILKLFTFLESTPLKQLKQDSHMNDFIMHIDLCACTSIAM